MKIKVFTHTDLDGIGPVVILKTLLEDAEIDYETHGYGTIDGAVISYFNDKKYLDYDMTLITDISVREDYSIEALRRLFNIGHRVALLDHHQTAEFLNQYLWANVQTEKPNCGTSLTLEYLKRVFPEVIEGFDPAILNDIEEFARLVSQWDTWLWAETEEVKPKQLNDLFYIHGRDEFLERTVNKLLYYSIFEDDDYSLLQIRQKQIDRYIETKSNELLLVDNAFESYTAGVVFAEEYFSELGHSLLKEFDEIDYVMMINMGKKTVSLRARDTDDIDVEAIAKASGFRFPSMVYDDCMMDIINSWT